MQPGRPFLALLICITAPWVALSCSSDNPEDATAAFASITQLRDAAGCIPPDATDTGWSYADTGWGYWYDTGWGFYDTGSYLGDSGSETSDTGQVADTGIPADTGWDTASPELTDTAFGTESMASYTADLDGDGVKNYEDLDLDGDGIANILDPDQDNDGILNEFDNDSNADGYVDGFGYQRGQTIQGKSPPSRPCEAVGQIDEAQGACTGTEGALAAALTMGIAARRRRRRLNSSHVTNSNLRQVGGIR